MNTDIVQQFKQKHESLAGIVHLVDGFDEAAARVGSILKEKKADKVAMTELPEELKQSLEQRCATTGINLLMPPFNGADLPGALDTIQVGITRAAFAIAETGSLVEFATDDAFRLV